MRRAAGVILLAAGAGRRFGARRPKQLIQFDGKPLFRRSLEVFLGTPGVTQVVLVVPPGREARFATMLPARARNRIRIAPGGRYRGESVRNGFRALDSHTDAVLIHDAARPMVTRRIVRDVLAAARRHGAALAAWPLPDTLKFARGEFVRRTIPRKGLWLAQTPQAFRRNVAQACLLKPSRVATDDAELAERRGFRVKLVPASPANMKVTYPRDVAICRAFLNRTK